MREFKDRGARESDVVVGAFGDVVYERVARGSGVERMVWDGDVPNGIVRYGEVLDDGVVFVGV